MKIKIQYPKLTALLITILTAYILFRADFFKEFAILLNSHGYISVFIAGMLFAYGFTAPFAVGFFVSLAPSVNIFAASLLAGAGALLSDFFIFQFIRHSFGDEFELLKLSRLFQKIKYIFDNHIHDRIKKYALWAVAGFLIASPLPDEFGISLISGFTEINKKIFAAFSYGLNAIGIFAIFALA